MEKGTYHTEETKKRMSETRKGEKHPFYGRHHSEETKQKIRLARAKQVNTRESNRKRSEKLKGRKFSEESIQKMRDHALKRFSKKENHPFYGKKRPEVGKINSEKFKGISYDERHGKKRSKEIRQKLSEKRALQIFPKQDTKIEVKIQDFLKALKIEFFTHQHMNIEHGYQCDIFIPSMNLVVECDGIYWHKYPTGTEIDHIRTKELIEKGFRVLRLWENDIKDMSLNKFQELIQ